MKLRKVRSFTLVEVLVILALAILLSILIVQTFNVISKSLFSVERVIEIKNTLNLIFEYYRSVPYDHLNEMHDIEVTHYFVDPRKSKDLRIFCTITPYRTLNLKKIKLKVIWGNPDNPYSMEMETLRYRYGI